MPMDASTHDGSPGLFDAVADWMRGELLAVLESETAPDARGGATTPADRVLGSLSGLLIAKWVAYDESEREAIAAFNEESFTPELPEALRLSAWDRPTEHHASEVAAALREMTADGSAGSAAACHVARVAPLVTQAIERAHRTYERLHGWVGRLDLGTSKGRTLAARLFDDVLRTVMTRQGNLVGEFVTPNQVATLMLDLADPQPGDRVYDPCFGFGELLVGAAHRLREAAQTEPPRVWAGIRQAGIFGIEINRLSHAVGLCRILLAGIDRSGLELGDALERPLPRSRSRGGFDCILAVPPWGRRVSRKPAVQFPFPSRHSETLFLQHVMANLRPGGRAVVALPEGPLYRLGPDRRMRKALLSDYSVDAVVSLPAGAFAPWTGIAVNLLVFRRAEPRSAVRFASITANAWKSALEAGGVGIPDVVENEDNDPGARGYGFPGGEGFGDSSGSGVGIGAESRFGGVIESSAGTEDGSVLGRVAGPDAGSGDGSDLGREETPSVGSDGGTRYGYGHVPPVGLLRGVPELIRHRHELSGKAFRSGVEVWDVAVRELGLRGYELVAGKPESKALDTEMERLVALDSSVAVERLECIAEVSRGAKYGRRVATRSRDAPDVLAGLLRAGDVRDAVGGVLDTGIQAPSLFLAEMDAERVDDKHILRSLDVIVTTSGIVGRVAFIPPSITRIEVVGTSTVSNQAPADATEPTTEAEMEDTPAPADGGHSYLLGIGGLFMPVVATDSVAVIRAREHVTPAFLAALLRSPVYRNWLSSHARGSGTRTLPVRTLRGLRVPLPPLQVQDAVLDELARSGGDAMAVLLRLLSRAASEPVAVWLETPAAARLASWAATSDPDQLFSTLVAATKALQALMDRMSRRPAPASSESDDPWLGAWLDIAREVAAVLGGIESIPRGTGRLAVLGVALSRLHEALSVLDGATGPTVGRLHVFTRTMIELSEREVHAMQESIKLDVSLEPAEVTVGTVSEVGLRLVNSSVVPLRSLHVSTRPPLGTGQLPYLADGETHRIPLTVHPRDATQPLPIVVSWRARRLDGTAVDGEVEVALRVLSTREVVRSGDLGASPYIVGTPVDRHEMFFGRTDIMDRIRRQLGASTHANVILLEGNRRTGKTSILRQLGNADVLPGWIPVYCSLQDAEGDDSRGGITTRNVFKLLARTTGWSLSDAGVETWLPGLPQRETERPYKLAFLSALNQAFSGDRAFETFELYLSAAVDAASPRRVLFMLDEFDKLQEGIDAGITSPQVPENIRHLLQHQPGVSAIITGSRRLKRLREDYWSALFGLGYRIGISALSRDDARRLVTEPVEGRLAYLPQARDRLVDLCACHPFLVQSLCNRVFEQAAAAGASTVTVDAVRQAATEMVQDNEHFRTLWDYTGTARRGLLLALCDRLQDGPDEVNLDLLKEELRKREVPVRRVRDLDDDLTELRELELLDFDESFRSGTYRLAVPLMAKWLRMNVDFDGLVVRAREEAMEAPW